LISVFHITKHIIVVVEGFREPLTNDVYAHSMKNYILNVMGEKREQDSSRHLKISFTKL